MVGVWSPSTLRGGMSKGVTEMVRFSSKISCISDSSLSLINSDCYSDSGSSIIELILVGLTAGSVLCFRMSVWMGVIKLDCCKLKSRDSLRLILRWTTNCWYFTFLVAVRYRLICMAASTKYKQP